MDSICNDIAFLQVYQPAGFGRESEPFSVSCARGVGAINGRFELRGQAAASVMVKFQLQLVRSRQQMKALLQGRHCSIQVEKTKLLDGQCMR
jgi:hypothetical protein